MLIGDFNIDRAQQDPAYLRAVKAFLRSDTTLKIPCRTSWNGLKVEKMNDLGPRGDRHEAAAHP